MNEERAVPERGTTTEQTTRSRVRAAIASIAGLCTIGAAVASVAAPRKWF